MILRFLGIKEKCYPVSHLSFEKMQLGPLYSLLLNSHNNPLKKEHHPHFTGKAEWLERFPTYQVGELGSKLPGSKAFLQCVSNYDKGCFLSPKNVLS